MKFFLSPIIKFFGGNLNAKDSLFTGDYVATTNATARKLQKSKKMRDVVGEYLDLVSSIASSAAGDSSLSELETRWYNLWQSEDALIKVSYAPAGVPNTIEGKEGLTTFFNNMVHFLNSFRFYNVEIYDTKDKNVYFVVCDGEAFMNGPNGLIEYNNHFLYIIYTDSKKITRVDEYFNPINFGEALAGPPSAD